MALKISLKPGERLFLGGAAIANGRHACELTILNNVQVLREREIMREEAADTPCKRLYLTVQMMYMDPASLAAYHDLWLQQASEIVTAAPSLTPLIGAIGTLISKAEYYAALKQTRLLIDEEIKLFKHADNDPAHDLPGQTDNTPETA